MGKTYEVSVSTSKFCIEQLSDIAIDTKGTPLIPKNFDLLFIPYKQWHDKKGPLVSRDVFPLFEYLRSNHPELLVEVFVGLEDYVELGLHGSFKNFGKVYIAPTVFGLLLNIISNYAYDAMKNSDKPEARITIETQISNSNVTIYYSGSPDQMTEKVTTIAKKLETTDKKDWDKIFKEYKGKNENRACTTSDN